MTGAERCSSREEGSCGSGARGRTPSAIRRLRLCKGAKTKEAHGSPAGEDLRLPPSRPARLSPARLSSRCLFRHETAGSGNRERDSVLSGKRYGGVRGRKREEEEESRERLPRCADNSSQDCSASSFAARNRDYRCDLVASGGAYTRRNVSAIELRGASSAVILRYYDPCRSSNVHKGTIVSDSDGKIEAEEWAGRTGESVES